MTLVCDKGVPTMPWLHGIFLSSRLGMIMELNILATKNHKSALSRFLFPAMKDKSEMEWCY